MSIYGITAYGTDVYGLSLAPAYSVEPFTAQPVNYGTIQVTWTKPTGTIFRYRLIANRYGYPVNEHDGTVIFDSVTYPGSNYVDTAVIPGTYHYYGFYVLADLADNIWIRSGVAGCLSVKQYGSSEAMWQRLPEHFRTMPATGGELTGDASGNSYLQQFVDVLGFGADYLRTQYGMLAEHYNDPMTIPIDDLWNLAAEVGMSFSPELPAYTIRKAIANQAHVAREGGTTTGIDNEIILRTGWSADVTTGVNLMLENDQSTFLDPVFPAYSATLAYRVGEYVWYGPALTSTQWQGTGYWYKCIQAGVGVAPSGAATSNARWQVILDADDTLHTLTNAVTGNPNTWEAIDPSVTTGVPSAGSLIQGLGVSNLTATGNAWNSLRLKNTAATAKSLMLRSVSRTPGQFGGTPWAVDPQSAIQDGIPVPYIRDSQQWDPTVRYGTGDLILQHGQPFKALRASTGVNPPVNNTASPEWAPVSESRRLRLAVSGYVSDDISLAGTTSQQAQVIPFVEWYDSAGNFIARQVARNPSAGGVLGKPDNLVFDSFTGVSRVFGVQGNNTAALGPWQATYYANPNLSGAVAGTQSVPTINFNLTGVSQPLPTVGNAGWSATWTTRFVPPATGTYTFSLKGIGGGTRMLVNGVTVINAWSATPTSLTSAAVVLPAGTGATVEVDYASPKYTAGTSWGPNYLPSWIPPSNGPESKTLPGIAVVSGYPYELLIDCTSATGHLTANITWYNNGKAIGNTGATDGINSMSIVGNVPVGANSAVVYLGTNGARTGYAARFAQKMGAPVTSSLTVTSPVPLNPSTNMISTTTLTGRITEDNVAAWTTPIGNFAVGNGTCWPLTPGQRSIGLVTGPANTKVGVTFRSSAPGYNQGITARYTDDNNYWRIDRTAILKKAAGVWTTLATHSTSFADNDRMIVVLNGPVIQVFRNAGTTPVSSVSDAFNSSATRHGIVVE